MRSKSKDERAPSDSGLSGPRTDRTAHLSHLIELAVSGGVPRRAALVALVVGTVLNAIAQGDLLLAGQSLIIWKTLLTYCVPYCVATTGAVGAKLQHERDIAGLHRAYAERSGGK